MNPTRWARVQELVEAAAGLPTAERHNFLEQQVPEDLALRREVETLLAAYDSTGMLEDILGHAAAQAIHGQSLEPGDRVGPWLVLGLLGHGGMGSVYRAERADQQFQQEAAIKLVRSGVIAQAEMATRFRTERQILASISHPNIARLLDGGLTGFGVPYLVMEYVHGEPLDRYLLRVSPSLTARLQLFQAVCSAVQYAHQNLVVHRDLKPANILVTDEGVPVLLDFGIAKLLNASSEPAAEETRFSGTLMTPEYASPEQLRYEPITTATDIYSLGVVLYELLTGRRPFQLSDLSPAEMERRVTQASPVPPSIAGMSHHLERRWFGLPRRTGTSDLDRIVLKSMHKVPARRYSSAGDLSADLQRYLEGFPVAAQPDSFAYRSGLFVRRHRLAVAAVSLFSLAILALTVTALVLASRARREAASATSVAQFLVSLFEQSRPDSTQGQDLSARQLLDQGMKRLNAEPVQDPLVHARLLSTLGRVYFDLGVMDRASSLLLQAEAIQQAHPKEAEQQLAETENALGTLELERNLPLALTHYQRALKLFQTFRGPDSSEVADVQDSIAGTETALGHFDQAELLFERSIRIHTRMLGGDAEATLNDKHNLASLYAQLGDYRREQPLLQDVLAAHRRTSGDLHEITTSDIGNLAWLEDRLGHFARSEQLSHEVIALKSKLFGAENPRLAMQMLVLGDTLRQTGRLQEARTTLERGLGMATRFEGANSLHSAWIRDELGLVSLAEGNLPEARVNITAALAAREAQPLPPLQDVALSYEHLGLLETAEHNATAAEQHLRRALELQQKVFPRPNLAVAESKNDLATLLFTQQRRPEACALLRSAATIAHESVPNELSPQLAAAQHGIEVGHCP